MRSSLLIYIVLVLTVSAPLSNAQESKLRTYGYFDLELEWSNKDAAGKRSTFDQHHFNVITVYQLDERFRVFAEIEWEHGVSLQGGKGSGLVAVERAWVEYKHADALKIQVGKFLPPFGIYNLKHDATPTFLSTFLPSSIYGRHKNTLGQQQRLYAKFATGIQVLGTLFANRWQGEYYVYLSNGRGPNPDEADNNGNKGVGGRLVVGPPIDDLNLGVSFYTDKNGEANSTEQTTIAFDASIYRSNFQIEVELFIPKIENVDTTGAPVGSFRTGSGYYVQGGYTLFDKLTPFARYDFFDPNTDVSNDGERDVVLGMNLAVTPSIYLKGEIHFLSFQNPGSKSFELFASSIAVAF